MLLDQVSISKYHERTLRMKKRIVAQPHEICIERAKLMTESYKMTKGEDPILRFAKALDYYLSKMTIKIWEDEVIVGNRCTKPVGTPLFPEVRVDTIEQDVDSYDTRPVQPLFLTDEDRRVLKEEIVPYWKNEDETVQARFDSRLPRDLKKIMYALVYVVDTEMTNGFGHFLPGHENILKWGINGLIKKAEDKLKEFSDAKDAKKRTFLESVLIVCNAAKKFIQRFSDLTKKLAENEPDSERQKELLEISQICHNISENPPGSFKEALQLIYFNHLITGLEDGGFAISVGRLDQYLYPYYVADNMSGEITPEETQFLCECFFLKLCTLWNYILGKGVVAAEGPPIAENLTIGGVDREDNDATNELSYILLDAYTHLKTVQPTFSVRVHQNTPDELIHKVGESVKSGASIAFFNDHVMVKGLQNRGFTLEDAREYAPIGCVEPQHPHKSFGSTNANQLNIVKCLELTISNGLDTCMQTKYGLRHEKEFTTYEELWEAFLAQMRHFIKYMVNNMVYLDEAFTELNPQPFLSATIDDCIERGLDITNGGAVYDFTGPQLIGLATVADSLAVIKKFVFEEKLLPFEDLDKMLRRNFKGTYQDRKAKEWQQIFINKAPKFGNDDDYVDQIAVDIAQAYCDEIAKYTNYRGGKYNPGIYSTAFHLALGVFTGASADGRKLGEALSNGVSSSNGLDRNGPTALLNSVKKLPNELMTNGNSLILAFHPNALMVDKLPPLIRTFFGAEGGYHIQFNVVGKETLLKAQQNPDEYRDLVVRIAGYSVYFTELSNSAQNDIIARTECTL